MMELVDRVRARRQLRELARLDAATPEGTRVQVTGTVRAIAAPLVAPISAAACVAFDAHARGYRSSDGKIASTEWHETVARFAVERDGAHPVLVDGRHVRLFVSGRPRARQPERESRFLASHAIHLGGARFHEVVLEVGRRVIVGGTLVLVPATTPAMTERGFRDAAPLQAQLSGSREQPLVIVTC